jgi:26S proteasome regulatory subunit N10
LIADHDDNSDSASPQVLATLTQDLGKVLSALQQNHIGGQVDLSTALNVAQLALKHRENKNQRQRIIVFLGSPLVDPFSAGSSSATGGGASEEALIKLGKKLKKNNVAVDLVLFGDEGMGNEQVLSKFIEATQNSENW